MFLTLLSASGAPGVSTTALGVTLNAPIAHTLLVEADTAGYSPTLAGYWQAGVPHSHSLINLVEAHREGRLAQDLPRQVMRLDNNSDGTTSSVLPGLMNAAQGEAMRKTWDPVGHQLASMTRDNQHLGIIVDGGRLAPSSGSFNLIRHSDVIAIMTRPTLTAAVAVQSALVPLRKTLQASRSNASIGLVLVGGAPTFGGYDARDFSHAVGLDVITEIPDAPRHAAAFSFNTPLPRWSIKKSVYLRSIRNLWAHVERHHTTHQPEWVLGLNAVGDSNRV